MFCGCDTSTAGSRLELWAVMQGLVVAEAYEAELRAHRTVCWDDTSIFIR